MDALALWGMILITSALVFYSIGVWGEFYQKTLKRYHVIFFWLGLTCDTFGTSLMFLMADKIALDIHSISGAIAILLMLFHAIWATKVERSGNELQKQQFHRYSLIVWFFWLIPYFYPSASMANL